MNFCHQRRGLRTVSITIGIREIIERDAAAQVFVRNLVAILINQVEAGSQVDSRQYHNWLDRGKPTEEKGDDKDGAEDDLSHKRYLDQKRPFLLLCYRCRTLHLLGRGFMNYSIMPTSTL
jgi:hypothetical protein